MAPSHVVFGEKKSDAHRIMAIKRTVASMAVNNDAGKLSDADFESKIGIFRCFLMQWFGFGGSQDKRLGDFNAARKCDFSSHLFGNDLFNAMLTCCDKPSSRANPSPLDDPLQREKWAQERQREYYQDNREDRLAYDRQYRQRKRARINEQQQAVREARLAQEILALESEQQRRESFEKKNAERKQQRLEQQREYRAVNRDRINERQQQRRETNKEKKARAEAERISKKAEVALTQYKKLKEAETLERVTRDDMKSLLAYIVPLCPVDEHDKLTKYTNVEKMRERLGLPPKGGLHCKEECLSIHFSNEWKEKWLARILGYHASASNIYHNYNTKFTIPLQFIVF
eukprot:scaffold2710_cov168-Skeletonema_marinoi.AAC.3